MGMMGPGGQPITQGGDTGALWAVDSGGTGEDSELDDETTRREIVGGLLKASTLISVLLLATYLVAVWAMAGKPG